MTTRKVISRNAVGVTSYRVSLLNAYQLRKAKQIANFLLECREQSTLGRLELAKVVAIMSPNEWRTVCFATGVPSADLSCKAAVLALLRGRSIHAITSSRTSVTA